MEIGKLSIISKAILLSCSVSLLSACGGSSDKPVEITEIIESEKSFFDITVIDGYVRGAIAYIDLNSNKVRDNDEPFVVTTQGGKGQINITGLGLPPESISIIVDIPAGAIDESTISDENPAGIAITDETAFQLFSLPGQNLATPLTTLVVITAQTSGIDIATATAQVADNLNITTEQVNSDYIGAQDTQLAVLNELLIANSVIPQNITQGVDAADVLIATHVTSTLSSVIQAAITAGNLSAEDSSVIDAVAKVTTTAIARFVENNKATFSTETLSNFEAIIADISKISVESFQPLITATETVSEADIAHAAQQANIMTDVVERLLKGYVAKGVTTDITDDILNNVATVATAVKTTINNIIANDKDSEQAFDMSELTDIARVTAVAVTETLTSLADATLTEQEIANVLAQSAQRTAEYLEQAIRNDIEINDFDGDGIVNDEDSDIDGDNVLNADDAFDFDATESVDTDGDNIGNNSDTDDEGDNIADRDDAFPLDKDESVDTDGDNIGNNADTDDDGDGTLDVDDEFPEDNSLTTSLRVSDIEFADKVLRLCVIDNYSGSTYAEHVYELSCKTGDKSRDNHDDTYFYQQGDYYETGEYLNRYYRTDIADLSGIFALSNLTTLLIPNSAITDVSLLVNLTKLKALELTLVEGTDISVLSSLINLESITLPDYSLDYFATLSVLPKLKSLTTSMYGTRGSEESDEKLATIASLTSLETLKLEIQDGISSFEPLSILSNLKHFELKHRGKYSTLTGLTSLSNLATLVLTYPGFVSEVADLTGLSNLTSLTMSSISLSDKFVISLPASLQELSIQKTYHIGSVQFEGLINLERLDLSDNSKFTDISALAGLINLKELNLSNNYNLKDISALAGLTNLKELDLSENRALTDISALAALTSLDKLDLYRTGIDNISTLPSLTNLKTLNLSYTFVDELSAIGALTNLKVLSVAGVNINDIAPLTSLVNLEILNMAYAGVSDLSALSSLTKLKTLNISQTSVNNLTAIENLTSLKHLKFDNTAIKDISPLASLANLQYISFFRTGVSVLSPLSDLVNLETVILQGTSVEDLTPLSNFKNIKKLYIADNDVTDLTPLVNLTGLEYFKMGSKWNSSEESKEINLTALTNLSALKILVIDNSNVVDLAPLSELGNLEALLMYCTAVEDLTPLFEINSLLFLTNYHDFDDQQVKILTDKGVFWGYFGGPA